MASPLNQDRLSGVEFEDGGNMSHGQMKDILRKAEKRMRAATKISSPGENDHSFEDTEITQKLPKLKDGASRTPYITSMDGIATSDPDQVLRDRENKPSSPLRHVKEPIQRKTKRRKGDRTTAGSDWYNLPKTNLTPELKRDLQLMKMRGVLDPKRHYKTDTSRSLIPEFSQVGSIIEGPTEYFSSRVPHKERKRTLVEEEVLGDKKLTDHFGTKYNDTQALKTSGKKSYYRTLKEKRQRGFPKPGH